MSTATLIKEVALHLFAQKGYEGTALSEIADGVGIKKPSLYAHFNGKDDLFVTVFKEVLDEYTSSIHMALKELNGKYTAEEKLRHLLFCHCRYYKDHKEHAAFLKRATLFPPSELAECLHTEFSIAEVIMNEWLIALFQEGIDSGEIHAANIDDLLATYNCLIDGFFLQMFYYKEQDAGIKIQSAWKIFWQGISDGSKPNG